MPDLEVYTASKPCENPEKGQDKSIKRILCAVLLCIVLIGAYYVSDKDIIKRGKATYGKPHNSRKHPAQVKTLINTEPRVSEIHAKYTSLMREYPLIIILAALLILSVTMLIFLSLSDLLTEPSLPDFPILNITDPTLTNTLKKYTDIKNLTWLLKEADPPSSLNNKGMWDPVQRIALALGAAVFVYITCSFLATYGDSRDEKLVKLAIRLQVVPVALALLFVLFVRVQGSHAAAMLILEIVALALVLTSHKASGQLALLGYLALAAYSTMATQLDMDGEERQKELLQRCLLAVFLLISGLMIFYISAADIASYGILYWFFLLPHVYVIFPVEIQLSTFLIAGFSILAAFLFQLKVIKKLAVPWLCLSGLCYVYLMFLAHYAVSKYRAPG